MSAPIGLSFGDIIQGAKVLRSIIKVLRDQRGAIADYEGVIQEIEQNALAFEQLQHLELRPEHRQHANAIIAQAGRALSTINDMHTIVSKNRIAFDQKTSQSWYRDPLKRVKWVTKTKKVAEKQRAMLDARTTALKTMIAGLTLELCSSNQQVGAQTLTLLRERYANDRLQLEQAIGHANKIEESLNGLLPRLHAFADNHKPLSEEKSHQMRITIPSQPEILGEGARSNPLLLPAFKLAERSVHQRKPPDWQAYEPLLQDMLYQDTTMFATSDIETAINLCKQQAMILVAIARLLWKLIRDCGIFFLGVISQLDGLPPMITSLLPDNMTLIDPLGRIHSLPLPFFQHWRVLESLLWYRFKALPGAIKIAKSQFRILDIENPGQVIDPRMWSSVAAKRKRFKMSFIISTLRSPSSRCIKCHSSLTLLGSHQSVCKTCGLFLLVSESRTAQMVVDQLHNDRPRGRSQHRDPPAAVLHGAVRTLRPRIRYQARQSLRLLMRYQDPLMPTHKKDKLPDSQHIDCDHSTRKVGDIIAGDSSEQIMPNCTFHIIRNSKLDQQDTRQLEDSELRYFTSVSLEPDTRLHDAALEGKAEVVAQLIGQGFNPRENIGSTGCALNAAIISGSTRTVHAILEAVGNPLGDCCPPPIAIAAKCRRSTIGSLLIKSAQNASSRKPSEFQNAMDWALLVATQEKLREGYREGHPGRLLQLLVEKGANPMRSITECRSSAFLKAWEVKNAEMLALFIQSLRVRGLVREDEAEAILVILKTKGIDWHKAQSELRMHVASLDANEVGSFEHLVTQRIRKVAGKEYFFQVEASKDEGQ